MAFSHVSSRHTLRPNLCVGSKSCGTKIQHTQVWSVPPKEIHFDEHKNEKGHGVSNISSWARYNKKTLTASAALIAAAAFSNPLASFALADTTSVVSSASSVMNGIVETGFYQAFSLVFVSEIGDKTFFIAGLLAMKAGRLVSLIGSVGALAVMTIISVLIGQIFHAVPPGISQGIPLDDVAAVLAFAFFGLKTLKEASEIEEGDNSGVDEEYEEAVEAVDESKTIREVTAWGKILSTFGLVFAAEFGDRSFISTIALSAAQNPVSVAVGAIAAHALATGIAVASGSALAKYISEKTIGYIGGSLFLIFAVTTALGIF
eukprot:CAMPEP_0176486742 /NCGR_PEP_ID=MMETSP0200_2-20121128/5735_1 /TAXON_ID=947934 /ORGANISM="Chaetoceros sp., Strain GSL56" /LENGTH=317 /DNA_ID=CAMNT_0017883473 /DNA_START=184 /DNA_END=1137 /DNA_ORIENTATION=-